MSIEWKIAVEEHGPARTSDWRVLHALAGWANKGTGICWPSVPTIAESVRMTERGVRKILRRLEADGWIETERGGGRSRSNRYRLRLATAVETEKTGTTFPRNPEQRSPEPVREPIREDGGCAHAREADQDLHLDAEDAHPPEFVPSGEPVWAENASALPSVGAHELTELTEAATVETLGRSPRMGDAEDRLEVAKWGRDLGLTHAEQLEVIREVMRTRRAGERVIYLRYFRAAMARYAKAKAEKLDADKLALGTAWRGAGGGRKGRKTLGELMAGAMAYLDGPPALQARVYGRDF